ncbi:MAG: MarR family transcriptional regulator [Caulobacter sp.]
MTSTLFDPGLGFGSRLRRLIDRLDRDVTALYAEAGLRFEPRWYAVFSTLRAHGPLSVGALARRLGVTHAAVSQVRAALTREGLIEARTDPADGRRQDLALTPLGAATALQLQPLWDAINTATAQVLERDAPGLLHNLEDLARALDRRSIQARVKDLL